MALNTQTLLSLIQKLAEANSDYLSFSTTTNITTNNLVKSTTLNQYDESEDDHFGGADTEWWLYITGTANVGVHRRCTDYLSSSAQITVAGAVLAAESGAATCQIFRYNRDHYKNALIEACNEIYPALHKKVDNRSLISGNILPDGSFESWASASSLNWYTAGSATIVRTSATTYVRGQKGSYSVKVTAGGANDYIQVDSDVYPRLLDLAEKEVDGYVWAYAETANDPSIEFYTLDSAGSTQTLTSTTTAAATRWQKLKLESQSFNDNLVYVRIRLGVATNAKYVYFDDFYVSGMRLTEYLLPDDFVGGHLSNVYIQEAGYSDEAMYDMHPFQTEYVVSEPFFDIIRDGTNDYLKLSYAPDTERRLRLIGHKPLETLSADSDPITIDSVRLPLLIAKARMIFWERGAVPISTQDKTRFEIEYSKAERDYRKALTRMRMVMPAELVKM